MKNKTRTVSALANKLASFFETILGLISSGKISVKELISEVVPLKDFNLI